MKGEVRIMAYEGSCHCGAVTFTVEGDLPEEAISCNCTYCRRKGTLLAFVPASQFTLDSGEEVLRDYLFNTERITHRFCTVCGTQAFAYGKGRDGAEMRAINLRCVPSVDLDALEVHFHNGLAA